jgi:hypothetical protein
MAVSNPKERVAALGDLPRPELVDLWTKRYGCPPPFGVRQPLLIRAAAWHLQEKQFGGLSANAKRLLKATMKRVNGQMPRGGPPHSSSTIPNVSKEPTTSVGEPDARMLAAGIRPLPAPGARLIRDWNGRRYVVDVIDGAFVLDGKHYRSLTAIAFRITGAKWSGPRFFGL